MDSDGCTDARDAGSPAAALTNITDLTSPSSDEPITCSHGKASQDGDVLRRHVGVADGAGCTSDENKQKPLVPMVGILRIFRRQ